MKNSLIILFTTILTQSLYSQNIGLQVEPNQHILAGNSINGPGGRLMWLSDKEAIRAGIATGLQWDQDSIGLRSSAFGGDNIAKGNNSMAWGFNNKASGIFGTAWGRENVSDGLNSTVWGFGNSIFGKDQNIGELVTAFGANNLGHGKLSTVWGEHNKAQSLLETVIGTWSDTVVAADPNSWNETDQLFVVGNGTANDARNNALTVLKNGDVSVDGNLDIGSGEAYKIGGVSVLRRYPNGDLYLNTNPPSVKFGNTLIGDGAGGNNQGEDNTALGFIAGSPNTSGSRNIFIGARAGWKVIEFGSGFHSGDQNVMLGAWAGGENNTGNNNTFIGTEADACSACTNNSNATAIGYRAIVDASNKVRIGNTSVSVIEGQVPFSPMSDKRLKTNITKTDIGLSFIQKLNPVTYNWKTGNNGQLFTGLIAQEVEQVAAELGYDFSAIVKPDNENGFYSLRYSDLVVPLINAVKELSKEKESMTQELDELKAEMAEIKSIIKQL